ncbi:hypothetical protein HMPREF1246_0476 [Acidaminococcus sp. BV3L6]|nr:hypothetical protein HMPREF1246_0476 [Acidaminococcus sp. BV3L6]
MFIRRKSTSFLDGFSDGEAFFRQKTVGNIFKMIFFDCSNSTFFR